MDGVQPGRRLECDLTAQTFPDIIFYLSAPNIDRSRGFRFIRYKHSPPALPVHMNTCYWGAGIWEKTQNGQVVTCGAP